MSRQEDWLSVVEFLNARDSRSVPERRCHRLPAGCYAAADHAFFFTLCARHHTEPFARPEVAERVIDALLWRRVRHRWLLYCYCLMPDHLHFILRLQEDSERTRDAGVRGNLPEGVLDQIGDFKRYTTTQVWWRLGGSGPLWQKSSYDRVLRHFEGAGEAAAYILNNPVRRGLVETWEAYPFSGIVDPWEDEEP
jgi:REP element-mobilizing transposase RayT